MAILMISVLALAVGFYVYALTHFWSEWMAVRRRRVTGGGLVAIMPNKATSWPDGLEAEMAMNRTLRTAQAGTASAKVIPLKRANEWDGPTAGGMPDGILKTKRRVKTGAA